MMKDETPDSTGPTASHFNRKEAWQGATTDTGAMILEINPERQHTVTHRRRMAELGKLADVHRRVVTRILDRSVEKYNQPKGPHLTVVK